MRLLREAAADNERVLTDPAPIATFAGFGDSCLNLTLRCYMPNLDGRLDVISELCAAIDDSYKEHGIVIPFPQGDINGGAPIEVKVTRD